MKIDSLIKLSMLTVVKGQTYDSYEVANVELYNDAEFFDWFEDVTYDNAVGGLHLPTVRALRSGTLVLEYTLLSQRMMSGVENEIENLSIAEVLGHIDAVDTLAVPDKCGHTYVTLACWYDSSQGLLGEWDSDWGVIGQFDWDTGKII